MSVEGDLACQLFLSCVDSLRGQDLIKRSPRGKFVGQLLDYIYENSQKYEQQISCVALWLVSKVQTCLEHGYTHKLPSVIIGEIWKRFHRLRCEKEFECTWNSHLALLDAPEECLNEGQLALQLLMDEIIGKLLTSKAKSLTSEASAPQPIMSLKIGEEMAIRYMAGYVAVKLLNQFKKTVKQPTLQTKYNLFVDVLKGMRASEQSNEEQVSSLSDYTTLWSELIDRGSLYHISDKVCN